MESHCSALPAVYGRRAADGSSGAEEDAGSVGGCPEESGAGPAVRAAASPDYRRLRPDCRPTAPDQESAPFYGEDSWPRPGDSTAPSASHAELQRARRRDDAPEDGSVHRNPGGDATLPKRVAPALVAVVHRHRVDDVGRHVEELGPEGVRGRPGQRRRRIVAPARPDVVVSAHAFQTALEIGLPVGGRFGRRLALEANLHPDQRRRLQTARRTFAVGRHRSQPRRGHEQQRGRSAGVEHRKDGRTVYLKHIGKPRARASPARQVRRRRLAGRASGGILRTGNAPVACSSRRVGTVLVLTGGRVLSNSAGVWPGRRHLPARFTCCPPRRASCLFPAPPRGAALARVRSAVY